MPIEFPITVNAIEYPDDKHHVPELLFGGQCGDMVAVRPCGEAYEKNTFLGVLLGEFPISLGCRYKPDSGTLEVRRSMYNPAIFIPERNSVVFGCESWWGKIESEEQLRQITDEDIHNVWYVRALNALAEKSKGEGEAA